MISRTLMEAPIAGYQRSLAVQWARIAADARSLSGLEPDEAVETMAVINESRRRAIDLDRQSNEFGIDGTRQIGLRRDATNWRLFADRLQAAIDPN